MKKSLVMAMAMAMGVTASAYAANPFSDVPAGHWAYDAVAQLAAAGVVDGYGTTFGGEKLMTRYEMAQIVAKAMAKGGNCDKLAAEFADELDALGVRVAKLEKKVDNVKITGQIRYSYRGASGDGVSTGGTHNASSSKSYNRFRTRLFVNGQVNDSWSYYGMLENDRYFGIGDGKVNSTNGSNNTVNLKRAWMNGRLGGIKLRAGRVYFNIPSMIDSEGDGVEAKYSFGKVNLTGWAAKNLATDRVRVGSAEDCDRMYMAQVDSKFGVVGAKVAYWNNHNAVNKTLNTVDIWNLGVDAPVAKDLKLSVEYFRGKEAEQAYIGRTEFGKNGWLAQLNYKGAKAAKPGTWGAWVAYQNRPASTMISPTAIVYAADYPNIWANDGFKGWEVGVNYAFAKNIVGRLSYYAFDARDTKYNENVDKVKTFWGELSFNF